jgi:hypothetical protein
MNDAVTRDEAGLEDVAFSTRELDTDGRLTEKPTPDMPSGN